MKEEITALYKTIRTNEQRGVFTIQLYRPEANNSINDTLIQELRSVLTAIEKNADIKVVILEGLPDNFCTGMDFQAMNESSSSSSSFLGNDPNEYYNLLKHFSTCSKIIISKVEGRVNAGGIGFVAASDIVIASEQATFGLSEALFGLLPACVMPFLIRRVGYQKAVWMTIITQGISSKRAYEIGLVDEITTNINDTTRKSVLRLAKLNTDTIRRLKDYSSKLWIINEHTQQLAVNEITSLISSESVQFNIKNFIENGKYPWDKS